MRVYGFLDLYDESLGFWGINLCFGILGMTHGVLFRDFSFLGFWGKSFVLFVGYTLGDVIIAGFLSEGFLVLWDFQGEIFC